MRRESDVDSTTVVTRLELNAMLNEFKHDMSRLMSQNFENMMDKIAENSKADRVWIEEKLERLDQKLDLKSKADRAYTREFVSDA